MSKHPFLCAKCGRNFTSANAKAAHQKEHLIGLVSAAAPTASLSLVSVPGLSASPAPMSLKEWNDFPLNGQAAAAPRSEDRTPSPHRRPVPSASSLQRSQTATKGGPAVTIELRSSSPGSERSSDEDEKGEGDEEASDDDQSGAASPSRSSSGSASFSADVDREEPKKKKKQPPQQAKAAEPGARKRSKAAKPPKRPEPEGTLVTEDERPGFTKIVEGRKQVSCKNCNALFANARNQREHAKGARWVDGWMVCLKGKISQFQRKRNGDVEFDPINPAKDASHAKEPAPVVGKPTTPRQRSGTMDEQSLQLDGEPPIISDAAEALEHNSGRSSDIDEPERGPTAIDEANFYPPGFDPNSPHKPSLSRRGSISSPWTVPNIDVNQEEEQHPRVQRKLTYGPEQEEVQVTFSNDGAGEGNDDDPMDISHTIPTRSKKRARSNDAPGQDGADTAGVEPVRKKARLETLPIPTSAISSTLPSSSPAIQAREVLFESVETMTLESLEQKWVAIINAPEKALQARGEAALVGLLEQLDLAVDQLADAGALLENESLHALLNPTPLSTLVETRRTEHLEIMKRFGKNQPVSANQVEQAKFTFDAFFASFKTDTLNHYHQALRVFLVWRACVQRVTDLASELAASDGPGIEAIRARACAILQRRASAKRLYITIDCPGCKGKRTRATDHPKFGCLTCMIAAQEVAGAAFPGPELALQSLEQWFAYLFDWLATREQEGKGSADDMDEDSDDEDEDEKGTRTSAD